MQFARAVCSTLNDMVGIEYAVEDHTLLDEPFSSAEGTIAFVYFSGTIQGNCLLKLFFHHWKIFNGRTYYSAFDYWSVQSGEE